MCIATVFHCKSKKIDAEKGASLRQKAVANRGCISPSKFLPLGNGEKWGGKIFSHGEMGKNGESYFGFKLTKKWYKIN